MQLLDPLAAYALLQANPEAVLVDCRTEIEFMYVGHPAGAEHVAWQEGPDWEIDPEFADKVKRLVRNKLDRPVMIICRSGQRSIHAGDALQTAGFSPGIKLPEGFEGPLDGHYHRGTMVGWRSRGLPWFQT